MNLGDSALVTLSMRGGDTHSLEVGMDRSAAPAQQRGTIALSLPAEVSTQPSQRRLFPDTSMFWRLVQSMRCVFIALLFFILVIAVQKYVFLKLVFLLLYY